MHAELLGGGVRSREAGWLCSSLQKIKNEQFKYILTPLSIIVSIPYRHTKYEVHLEQPESFLSH